VATFDLGPSMSQRTRSVNDIIKDGFPKSLKLGILAFLWAVVLGIPLGVLGRAQAELDLRLLRDVLLDHRLRVTELLRRHAAHLLRGAEMGLVPTNGWPQGFFQFDDRIILPSFALGLFPMAYFARLVRGSMLETMQQDYVRTARAKGLPYKRVIGLHVLRNS
jgi:ABC-type dipeptide/oligopeptide/nickel transport system permease component